MRMSKRSSRLDTSLQRGLQVEEATHLDLDTDAADQSVVLFKPRIFRPSSSVLGGGGKRCTERSVVVEMPCQGFMHL